MASVTLSGGSGNASGVLPGTTPVTTNYTYSTGWSTIPLGSQITEFSTLHASKASAAAASASTYVEALISWPTSVIGTDYAQSPTAIALGPYGLTTVFFSGNPGSVGSGYIRSDEYFYAVSYVFEASSSPKVYFNPPPSKTLFFGTAT